MRISARGRRLSVVLTLVKRYTKPQTTTNSCSYALIERSRYKERKQKKNAARRPENEQIAAHMRFWLSSPKCGGTMNGPHRKGSCGNTNMWYPPVSSMVGWESPVDGGPQRENLISGGIPTMCHPVPS